MFKFLGNLIWIIFTGLVSAIGYLLLGLIWCCTIIGIPFGIQSFKLAGLMFAPFGKKVKGGFAKHPIANVIWAIFGGFSLAIMFLFEGIIYCITIIGIPFGKQCFKLAKLSLFPFGSEVNR